MNEKIKIFLCSAKEDEKKAEQLYLKLKNIGYDPWLDWKNILPGQEWEPAVRKVIRKSDFFIICLSKSSIAKEGFLPRNFERALKISEEKSQDKMYFIPVRFEPCQVPNRLHRLQCVNLYKEEGFSHLMAVLKTCSVREIGRDDNFTAFKNDIVYDATTGLEWFVGPDRNTTCDAACSWVSRLCVDGGRWRMPKMEELRNLFKRGAGTRNMTPLLKTNGWCVWSEENDPSSAWAFDYRSGNSYCCYRHTATHTRGFAVRTRL